MTSWFSSRPAGRRPANVHGVGIQEQPAAAIARSDLDAAYRKGRLDEARRRRGSPLLTFLGLIAVASVALTIYLALQTGSLTNSGAVVDNELATASQTVQAPVKHAEDRAGAALEKAGQGLKQSAGDQGR